MAKNERIIAQDLAEIKNALQTNNAEDVQNWCHILKREISKYPVKPDITDRLESVANYSELPAFDVSIDEQINEIKTLIEILTSN